MGEGWKRNTIRDCRGHGSPIAFDPSGWAWHIALLQCYDIFGFLEGLERDLFGPVQDASVCRTDAHGEPLRSGDNPPRRWRGNACLRLCLIASHFHEYSGL